MKATQGFVNTAGMAASGGLLLSWLAFSSRLAASYSIPKLLVITVAAAPAAAAGIMVFAARRGGDRPRGLIRWWALVVGGVVALLVLSTITSDASGLSIVGNRNRNIGLLSYLAGFVLLGAAYIGLRGAYAGWLLDAMAVVGGVLTLWVVVDVITAGPDVGPLELAVASLGNPNFTSAVLGMAAVAGAGRAVSANGPWRAVLAGLAAASFVGAVMTGSIQGPIAALAGGLVLGTGWLWLAGGRPRRFGVPLAAVLAVVGVAVATAGIVGTGPLQRLATEGNVELRSFYWSAALDMGAAEPLTGVGLSRYPAYFRSVQSAESTARLGAGTTADDAHSVPLQMLASGGIPLLVAWLAFLMATAVVGIRSLVIDPDRRPVMLALLGVWVAYLVQSLVSIDVPAISTTHLVVAGAIAGTAAGPAAMVRAASRGKRRAATSVAIPGWWAWIGGGVGLTVLVVALVLVVPQYQAEGDVGLSQAALAAQDLEVAIEAGTSAATTSRFDPDYTRLAADAFAAAGDPRTVGEWAQEGMARDPRDFPSVITAGRSAVRRGEPALALELYDRGVALAPTTPLVYIERGGALLALDRSEEAAESFDRAIALAEGNAERLADVAAQLEAAGAEEAAARARDAVDEP